MSVDVSHEHLRRELAAELEDERVRLQTMAAQLAAKQRTFVESRVLEGSIAGDSADIATDVAEQERTDRLEAETKARLVEVEEALKRLEAGTYGRCDDCGQLIDPARLRARPSARRCLDCQRHAELAVSGRGRRR